MSLIHWNERGNLCLLQRAHLHAHDPLQRARGVTGGRAHRAGAREKDSNKIMCVAVPQENEMAVPQGKTGCAFAFAKLVTKEDP